MPLFEAIVNLFIRDHGACQTSEPPAGSSFVSYGDIYQPDSHMLPASLKLSRILDLVFTLDPDCAERTNLAFSLSLRRFGAECHTNHPARYRFIGHLRTC
jgi:hypothetical protein